MSEPDDIIPYKEWVENRIADLTRSISHYHRLMVNENDDTTRMEMQDQVMEWVMEWAAEMVELNKRRNRP